MINLTRKAVATEDIPDLTRNELESEWSKAKELFDEALAQKTEADRIYIAAANRLNLVERMVKKVEQRAVVAKRAAAKALFQLV
jgi:hypothetical protein